MRYATLLIALLACALHPAKAQTPKTPLSEYGAELYIDTSELIDTTAVTVKGSSQGLALWGRYAFSLHDKGQCVVLDMKRRRFVSTFKLDGNDSHCNNASFGAERYSRQSAFPLLYISECRGERACYVTDISTEGSRIVQKIVYEGDDCTGPMDWCVDRRQKILYAYCTIDGRRTFRRFALPRLADSDATGTVRLTAADALGDIPVGDITIPQGSAADRRYIYLPDGVPSRGCRMHVVDAATGERLRLIDLNPLEYEPEGLDIKGGWLYLSFHVTGHPERNLIYRFRLKEIRKKAVREK